MLNQKDLLGLKNLNAQTIEEILSVANEMRDRLSDPEKKAGSELAGKSLLTLFYENSTRTRVSFELAAKYLGANVANIVASSSSVQKGETLIDTGKTLDSMKVDFIAIRHPMGGAPALLAKTVKASVLNAGDGINEHPTQALLDMLALKRKFGKIANLKVAIIGDIKHSRVAKSNLYGLTKLGARVTFYGPKTMMPQGVEKLGAHVAKSLEEALDGANGVMGLRIQLERQQGGLIPSLSEYGKFYGIREKALKYADKNYIILHPGPVNRGVELTPELIDGDKSVIEEQVTCGVAVRMALLQMLFKYREGNI